jgi:serine/threonine protein kinase
VNKGDVLNEAISHPDKYTESFVATRVAKPLLSALAYLHASNVIHR